LVQRFGSKRGLLLALAKQGGRLSEEFAAARAAHRSPLAALMAVSIGQTRFMDTPEALSNHVAFLQMDLNDQAFRELAVEGSRQVRRKVKGLLDEAIEVGELERCDTGRLAQAIQALFNGSIVFWAIHREGAVADWVRKDLETLLRPFRRRRGKT
jgi:hypothetical protein